MRSKDCLEIEKPSFYYYDLVKKAINDLYPLRADKRKTFEYFNLYLYSDARFRASKEKFELREGEVDIYEAYQVRIEILNAIMNDDSFIYAYNTIVLGDNIYSDNLSLKGYEPKTLDKDTLSNINEVISNYKEDYPKSSLCEYLTDKDNKEYYEKSTYYLEKNDSWWLEAFNLAYEVFDRIRVNSHTASEALKIVEEINTGDELLDNTSKEIICYFSENYSYDITEEQHIMLGLLSDLLKNSYRVPEKEIDVLSDVDEIQQIETNVNELEENSKNTFNCSQQTKGILYMLSALGVELENIKKITLAKFIHLFTGKNIRNIQDRMNISYDKENDIRDLKLLSNSFREILPEISKKIDNDCKPYT